MTEWMSDPDEKPGADARMLAGIRFRYQVGLHGPVPGAVTLTVGELGLLLDYVDDLAALRRSLVEGER